MNMEPPCRAKEKIKAQDDPLGHETVPSQANITFVLDMLKILVTDTRNQILEQKKVLAPPASLQPTGHRTLNRTQNTASRAPRNYSHEVMKFPRYTRTK